VARTIVKIGIGRTAETYATEQGTALKLFYDFMPADTVNYEYAVSKKVADVCPYAPAVYALRHRHGRMGIEYELIDGPRLVDFCSRQPLRIKALARRMGELHRDIHRISLLGLRMSADIYGDAMKKYPFIGKDVRSKLLQFISGSKNEALCHGDFHPENILVNRAGEYKIIDWINATSGDPLADVARTCYLMQSGKSPEKRPFPVNVFESFFRRILTKGYLEGYFQNTAVPKTELHVWDLIIRIHRYFENIPEEKAFLEKTIDRAARYVL
jgi:serine/threonine protein kinase